MRIIMNNTTELKELAIQLHSDRAYEKEISQFNASTRNKILMIHVIFLLTLFFYTLYPRHVYFTPLFILINGFFSLPYLRVFMHADLHWRVVRNKKLKFYIRWIIFGFYQIPFILYRYAHKAYHREYIYEIDKINLLPIKQSKHLNPTTIESKKNITGILNFAFILIFYNQMKYFIRESSKKDKIKAMTQFVVIIFMDALVYSISKDFFLYIFIPSIMIAWTISLIVIYMKHNIQRDQANIHLAVNSYSRLSNRFGDNDGLYIVHSLFPFLHPYHTPEIDQEIRSNLNDKQKLKTHYVIVFFKNLFTLD